MLPIKSTYQFGKTKKLTMHKDHHEKHDDIVLQANELARSIQMEPLPRVEIDETIAIYRQQLLESLPDPTSQLSTPLKIVCEAFST